MLDETTARALLERARTAREAAYAPYSGFRVGAAALTGDGSVFSGCNVENASYSLTNCAERIAVQSAVAAGHQEIRAVAVVGPDDGPAAPCGSCRQVLHEFGPDMQIVMPGGAGEGVTITPLAELLPSAFGPSSLPGRGG